MTMQFDMFEAHDNPNSSVEAYTQTPSISSARYEAEPVTPHASAPQTLAEVFTLFENGMSTHKRRAQFRSSCNVIGKVLGRPLDQIPTTPAILNGLLRKATRAAAGLTPRGWIGTKSTLRAALKEAGVSVVAARDDAVLLTEWRVLMEALPEPRLTIGLSRFVHFLSADGITPTTFTADALEKFQTHLEGRSLGVDPLAARRQAARYWNKAASASATWVQVRLQESDDPRRYALPWEAFPSSLRREVDEFIAAKMDPCEFDDDYAKPVREVTSEGRRRSLALIASAQVLSGARNSDEISSLSVLTDIDNVKEGLKWRRERAGGKVTPTQINHLWLLRTIARHWLKDEDKTARLKILIKNLSGGENGWSKPGMTAKNRERLRQFNPPKNKTLLPDLPKKILWEIRKKPEPSYSDAVRVMRALQVGILAYAPIRIKNLTEMEIVANLIDTGRGVAREVRVYLPAEITKNHRDYEAPLPKELYPILDAWMTRYRHIVSQVPNPYMFPNPRGERRSEVACASKLKGFILKETGIVMNVHLFRHLAGKLYLEHDPAGMEVLRQLLGHASTRTTHRAYAEFQTDAAFRRYEQQIQARRDAAPKPRKPSRKDPE
jgi:integrase